MFINVLLLLSTCHKVKNILVVLEREKKITERKLFKMMKAQFKKGPR